MTLINENGSKDKNSVETKNKYGMTPLNHATSNGHLEVVKYHTEQCHAVVRK